MHVVNGKLISHANILIALILLTECHLQLIDDVKPYITFAISISSYQIF
jgi:hypothetical protein